MLGRWASVTPAAEPRADANVLGSGVWVAAGSRSPALLFQSDAASSFESSIAVAGYVPHLDDEHCAMNFPVTVFIISPLAPQNGQALSSVSFIFFDC